ncbi:hypothetical protein MBRU_01425 [Mycolicibacterium brumae DSM 44177]|nr:hypothetical protein MBRU_01425 [Mycolicibacterium brumae DSM 44177]
MSAATEAAITSELGALIAGGAATLTTVTPMGADPTSLAFAAAANASGVAYIAAAAEHTAQRGLFSGAQGLAGTTFETTEGLRRLATTLGSVIG